MKCKRFLSMVLTLCMVMSLFAGTTVTASAAGGSSSSGNSSTISAPSAKNGTVSVSPESASKGSAVIVTVTPDKGYALETLTVTDASGKKLDLKNLGNGKYSFTMPASKVEVKATFMEDNTMLNYFVDVPASAYYYDAVLWAAEHGITGGTDATHFSPDGVCTRAQAVTFLWRAAGSPEPETRAMPFNDVPVGSYYYDAVLWAVENGITKGTSDTTFSPNMTCSRAQIVTFLWRSEKSPAAGTANPFADVKSTAYYADAVLWAVKENITKGTTSTTFSPNADCTRAQIVTFLWRAAGSPVVNYLMPFTDVDEGAYYAEAVRWAASCGIVTGLTETTFGTNGVCTRAQAATMIYRYAQAQGKGFTGAWMFHLPFTDVPEWAYESVAWCYMNGVTTGVSETSFAPGKDCTRAQIVTFLWRATGSPVVNYAMNMSDVPEGSYYAEAVRWALSEGIATGTTGSTFSPDETCTRAQAVAFLFRYAASEAVTLQELVSGFSDADSVPGYALPAMNWALAEEIVQGNGSKLMPNDSCTRAQIVTFLFRAYQGK